MTKSHKVKKEVITDDKFFNECPTQSISQMIAELEADIKKLNEANTLIYLCEHTKYASADLQRKILVKMFNDFGFSNKEIKKLLPSTGDKKLK